MSGLRGLSFERPLSTTNKMADQRNVLAASLNFKFIAYSVRGLLSVYDYRLFCTLQVDRVLQVGGLPRLACKRLDAFSKETHKKLALKG